MNQKLYIWILTIILLSTIVLASDGGVVDDNVTLRASLSVNNILFNDSIEANITIKNEINIVLINNQPMTPNGTGLWFFILNDSFTNTTGNYLQVVDYFNSSGIIAQGTESFEIRESEETKMLTLTYIFALLGLGFIFVYLSSQIKTNEVPKGRVPEKMIFYALSLGIVVAISGFLLALVQNNPKISYLSIPTNTIFIVILWCVFGIISFFMIYLYETVFKNKDKDEDDDD